MGVVVKHLWGMTETSPIGTTGAESWDWDDRSFADQVTIKSFQGRVPFPVIALVGYRPDSSVCQELRVGDPNGEAATTEPGYFVLGAKSKGRDSGFLIRDGLIQIQSVLAALGTRSKAA